MATYVTCPNCKRSFPATNPPHVVDGKFNCAYLSSNNLGDIGGKR